DFVLIQRPRRRGGCSGSGSREHPDCHKTAGGRAPKIKPTCRKPKAERYWRLFSAVVKNVASENIELKKLVYVYLMRYAEEKQDLALLFISIFQRTLKDPNQFINVMYMILKSIFLYYYYYYVALQQEDPQFKSAGQQDLGL
uniref:Clathrin/coatomer adaptor adaptin-like N-terminal domain-containing protein n=1 Tax=Astatotilapia calliptera TaxID=8154 RepID=A0AAX7U203_ASTCA